MYINNLISNTNLLFLVITFLMTICAIAVIVSKNPVHSILYLVLIFVLTTILFLTLNVEFLAMLFLVLYVGAIVVLFLFVVMMLNIRILELNERIISYIPIAIIIVLIFFLLILGVILDDFLDLIENNKASNYYSQFEQYLAVATYPNLSLIAAVLYREYPYLFLLAGIALLVAMLGSIVLTLNSSSKSKRQDYYSQTNKTIVKSIRHLK